MHDMDIYQTRKSDKYRHSKFLDIKLSMKSPSGHDLNKH